MIGVADGSLVGAMRSFDYGHDMEYVDKTSERIGKLEQGEVRI